VRAVYNTDENLTPVLLSAMSNAYLFYVLFPGVGLVTAGLDYNTGH